MEELRALVRKWNLHHKRNFWRENPSKDDVVAALNRHIRHMKVVHDNIENKKAERREADRKRQVQNTAGEGSNPPRMTSLKVRPPLENVSDTCLYSEGVPLRGLPRQVDAVSPADYVETGIIYMSRWGQEGNNNGEEPTSGRTDQAAIREDIGRRSISPRLAETRDDRNSGDLLGSKNTASKMQAQRKCSLALLNMTMRDQVRAKPNLLQGLMGAKYACTCLLVYAVLELFLTSISILLIVDCHAMQMSKAFLDEYGLLPPLLGIMHTKQAIDVLLMGLACVMNILSEEYKINKLVEAGLVGVARLLSAHEDELVQQYIAGILLAVSSCSGLEEWLVSSSLSISRRMVALPYALACNGVHEFSRTV